MTKLCLNTVTVFRRSYRQYVPSPAMAQGRGGPDMEADMKEDRNGKQVGGGGG